MERGVDIPNEFDAATDRANTFAALQRVWQEGCELPDAAEAVACRGDALLAVLQYKLAGNRHPALDQGSPGKALAAALSRQWEELWPGGLAIPEADLPNRVPLAAPLDPHVPLSEAEAIRLTTIERAFEPFEPRPPREVWQGPLRARNRHGGWSKGSPSSSRMPTSSGSTICCGNRMRRPRRSRGFEIATVDLVDGRREIRIDCPGSDGLALQGYVQRQGRTVLGGAIGRLQVGGQILTNLKVAGGEYTETEDGQGRLVVQLEERAAGLHARPMATRFAV